MSQDLKSLMQDATRLTRAGLLGEATRLIQRALGRSFPGGGAEPMVVNPHEKAVRPAPDHLPAAMAAPADADVIDVIDVREVAHEAAPAVIPKVAPAITPETIPEAESEPAGEAAFLSGEQGSGALRRQYKLFVPAGHRHRALPLVVMLHGCTQNPDDFAAGTGMNDLAQEQRFLVLYPAQSQSANTSRCWNWFKPGDQRREGGEPAVIAAMVRAVSEEYGVDHERIYIAGLSAGGAMAAVVANAYPDIFAAAGVHSGLACGSAHNVMEALSVMKTGAAGPLASITPGLAGANVAERAVPTIVFHGDRDHTVHPRNGQRVVTDVLGVLARRNGAAVPARTETRVDAEAGRERPYTRAIYADAAGQPVAEHWLVHGAGHAWAGGRATGSYTDPQGPDASKEMLRFFFQHTLADK